MKTKLIIFMYLLLCIATTTFAQMRAGEKISITEPTNDDLYVAGGVVTISAPVHGDLIIAGGTIVVEDTVSQDILIGGGNVTLKGFVGDDVRCAGGTVQVSNAIKGDLVVTGGMITVDKDSEIGGDVLSGGGRVAIHGNVNGNVKNGSGEFTFTGKIGQDLDTRSGKIFIDGIVNGNSALAASTIELGNAAVFQQNVRYWNDQGTMNFKNSVRGSTTYDPTLMVDRGKWHYLGFATFLSLTWYLGTALLMIVLIQYLFGKAFRKAANIIRNTSVKSLGFGLLFLVGTPIAILLCFITIIPIPIGVVMLLGYLAILIFATVIVALLIANWVNNTFYEAAWGDSRIMLVAFGIFVILKLASLTPFVGPLLLFLMVAMGFGGILLSIQWKRNRALSIT